MADKSVLSSRGKAHQGNIFPSYNNKNNTVASSPRPFPLLRQTRIVPIVFVYAATPVPGKGKGKLLPCLLFGVTTTFPPSLSLAYFTHAGHNPTPTTKFEVKTAIAKTPAKTCLVQFSPTTKETLIMDH